MKKLIALTVLALAASASATHPNTALQPGLNDKTWHTNEDIDYKEYDGKEGATLKRGIKTFKFKYPTLTYLNAKWNKDGQVFPVVICGYGQFLEDKDVEPSVTCFAKTADNTLRVIGVVDEAWYRSYLNGEIALGLTRGSFFVSNEADFYFRDVCDPYDGKKGNSCPTVNSLPKKLD